MKRKIAILVENIRRIDYEFPNFYKQHHSFFFAKQKPLLEIQLYIFLADVLAVVSYPKVNLLHFLIISLFNTSNPFLQNIALNDVMPIESQNLIV